MNHSFKLIFKFQALYLGIADRNHVEQFLLPCRLEESLSLTGSFQHAKLHVAITNFYQTSARRRVAHSYLFHSRPPPQTFSSHKSIIFNIPWGTRINIKVQVPAISM